MSHDFNRSKMMFVTVSICQQPRLPNNIALSLNLSLELVSPVTAWQKAKVIFEWPVSLIFRIPAGLLKRKL